MITAVLFAVAGAVVAGLFSAQMAQQYLARRREHALAWALALGLYAVGMVVLALGFVLGWGPGLFRVYWLAGALLNVALLAVGQLHLLDARRAVLWWTLGGLAAVWSLVATVSTPVAEAAFAAADTAGGIPTGREVFGGGLAYAVLRPITVVSALVVVLGSAYSGIRTGRYGILLIAAGVTVSATSSRFAAAGFDEWVAAVLTAGVTLMYVGFRAAARTPRSRKVQADPA